MSLSCSLSSTSKSSQISLENLSTSSFFFIDETGYSIYSNTIHLIILFYLPLFVLKVFYIAFLIFYFLFVFSGNIPLPISSILSFLFRYRFIFATFLCYLHSAVDVELFLLFFFVFFTVFFLYSHSL